MSRKITPFLMFEGKAEEAMNFYLSLFEHSSIKDIIRYGKGEAGKEGSVFKAVFILNEQEIICTDSPIKHNFTFTPAFSLFVECESAEEIERLAKELSHEGRVMMPLDNYGFSEKFAWMDDRYGVSWQLNFGLVTK